MAPDAIEADITASRVEKLLPAGEVSKAASAVWGSSDMVSAEDVMAYFGAAQDMACREHAEARA